MLLRYSVDILKTKATNFRNGFSLGTTGCGVLLRNRSFSHHPAPQGFIDIGCRGGAGQIS
jgi:hypothetical protein